MTVVLQCKINKMGKPDQLAPLPPLTRHCMSHQILSPLEDLSSACTIMWISHASCFCSRSHPSCLSLASCPPGLGTCILGPAPSVTTELVAYIFVVLLAQALWTSTVCPSSSLSADGTTSAMPLQDGIVSTGVHLHPLCLQGLARPECTVLLKMTAAWLNSTACDGYNIESDWDHWRPEMEWRSFKSSKR